MLFPGAKLHSLLVQNAAGLVNTRLSGLLKTLCFRALTSDVSLDHTPEQLRLDP